MRSFKIDDLFTQVGEIQLSEDGLYYCYTARVQTLRKGFVRLYYHGDRVCSLGVFRPSGDLLCCQGRIAKCRLDLPEEGSCFSLYEKPWQRQEIRLEDGLLPSAMACTTECGFRIVLPRHAPLPEEILPFFCFLKPEMEEGLPCLTMEVDRQGRPIVPLCNR